MHSPATEMMTASCLELNSFPSPVDLVNMIFHLIGGMKDGYSPTRTPLQQHSSPARPSTITTRSSEPRSPV
jgi:hypothetical protein